MNTEMCFLVIYSFVIGSDSYLNIVVVFFNQIYECVVVSFPLLRGNGQMSSAPVTLGTPDAGRGAPGDTQTLI